MTSMTSLHLNSVEFLLGAQSSGGTSTNGLDADRHPAVSDNPVHLLDLVLIQLLDLVLVHLLDLILIHTLDLVHVYLLLVKGMLLE